MSVELMARRYAGALADVVEKGGETATVQTELKSWEKMMQDSGDLLSLFKHPAIQYEHKAKVLDSLLAKSKLTKTTANFLRVLLRNQRLGDLGAINKAFAGELAERSNQVSAFVTTAHELSADQKTAYKKALDNIKCTCDCKMSVLNCRHVDRHCATSKQMAQDQLDALLKTPAAAPASK